MIDLHTHTTASDGTLTPTELIDLALQKKLKAVAITDHDTIDGYLAAKSYINANNISKDQLELISGIEFSTNIPKYKFDIHIIGLYMDVTAPAFIRGLEAIVTDRNNRNAKIVTMLQAANYAITDVELNDFARGSVITRSHFAKFLVEKGYFKHPNDAFVNLIGNNGPIYVPRLDVHAKSAIELILNSGGIPALAHPTLYGLDSNGLYALIDELKQYGLMGIESYYSLYSAKQTDAMLSVAKRFGLIDVGGSDFHGANKPNNDLGNGFGKLIVPDSVLNVLHNLQKSL